MPEHRTVFIGNLMGPFFGHVPNLYTLRGDKIRSAMAFIHSVDRVIALQPETLINGHDVFRGADEIAATMTKVRDATEYLRDRTIDGMNSGADLWTLMRDVTLPPELALPQVHGKVPWIVRAIWEEHVGWFRYESTTELYDVPPSSRVAGHRRTGGGTAALIERARAHAKAGRPLEALHLTDIVLAHSPGDADALRVKRAALEQLLAASGRENSQRSAVARAGDQERNATEEDAVKAENLYHTGIVVDDLDATMEWFTKVAGYTWTDVVTVDQEAVTPDGEITIPMRMAYSGRPSAGVTPDRCRHRLDARRLGCAPHRLLVRRRRIRFGDAGIQRHDATR